MINLIPQGVKDKISSVVAKPFNNHPKMTAITLITVGILGTLGAILAITFLGGNPFSMTWMSMIMLPVAAGGVGLSFGLYLVLRKTGHPKAAQAVLRVALPIIAGFAGGMLLAGGVSGFIASPGFMTGIASIVGITGIGFSFYTATLAGDFFSKMNKEKKKTKLRQQYRDKASELATLKAQ